MARATWVLIAGAMGATGVAAGAWAAHGLADQPIARDWAVTASNYQMLHAAALLGVVSASRAPISRAAVRSLTAARWLFAFGVVLFCGTLYALALGIGAPFAGSAPIGGSSLIVGWLAVGFAGAAGIAHPD